MHQAKWTTANQSPTVDDIPFKSLYEKEEYDVLTNDGWSLVMTRYKPVAQEFHQPLFGVPVLCVHGFSQNRHAWTSGEFVKNLLFFGLDVHLLELRGHGKSSVQHQHDRWENDGLPLPADVDYGWSVDSYFLLDVPAAIDAVKSKTGRSKIAYIGHSMGGMIGYGLASLRSDLSCLMTIGAPAELGKDFLTLRLVSRVVPWLGQAADATLAGLNGVRRARHLAEKHVLKREQEALAPWRYTYVPMDWLFQLGERALSEASFNLYARLSPLGVVLFNPKHTALEGIEWILKRGTHKEPRGVVEQFARWIRKQEMIVYRTGYDIKKNFKRIKIPLAIVFGDRDILASMKSTASIYRSAQSDYLLWRPVRGNSHIELTMGYDIRQICYDIKNLVEYAEHAGEKPRSLPRKGGEKTKPAAAKPN
ncbi:MAG: alpha/beta fold hydrolase [Deltaproteobacteria bacterium]|nr:alpha/beta fold hydrolase [Deltaproteobacteria bacterium]